MWKEQVTYRKVGNWQVSLEGQVRSNIRERKLLPSSLDLQLSSILIHFGPSFFIRTLALVLHIRFRRHRVSFRFGTFPS